MDVSLGRKKNAGGEAAPASPGEGIDVPRIKAPSHMQNPQEDHVG